MYPSIRDGVILGACLSTLIGQMYLTHDLKAVSYQISALEAQGCDKTKEANSQLDVFLKALQGGEGL